MKLFKRFMNKMVDNLALIASVVIVLFIVLVILIQVFNPFNFIDKAKDLLGMNRQSATELQEIVAGKLEGRRLLAEATREYSGDFILEKRGGLLNCAGETQFITDGIATARVVVLGSELSFNQSGDKVVVTIPPALLDTVDLKEDIDIVTDRNLCVRFTQLFGSVSSESEIREELRKEVQVYAEKDQALYDEALCQAKDQVREFLNSAGVDSSGFSITIPSETASCLQ